MPYMPGYEFTPRTMTVTVSGANVAFRNFSSAPSASATVCSPDRFCWRNPLPQGNALRGLWGVTPTDAWAVGDRGTMLRWDGAGWAIVASGTARALNGVWGSGATDVWAVGDAGTIAHWDGAGVATTTVGTFALRAVWGSGASDVWAVGDAGTIVRWNGTGWDPSASGTTTTLRAVWGSGAQRVRRDDAPVGPARPVPADDRPRVADRPHVARAAPPDRAQRGGSDGRRGDPGAVPVRDRARIADRPHVGRAAPPHAVQRPGRPGRYDRPARAVPAQHRPAVPDRPRVRRRDAPEPPQSVSLRQRVAPAEAVGAADRGGGAGRGGEVPERDVRAADGHGHRPRRELVPWHVRHERVAPVRNAGERERELHAHAV